MLKRIQSSRYPDRNVSIKWNILINKDRFNQYNDAVNSFGTNRKNPGLYIRNLSVRKNKFVTFFPSVLYRKLR